MIFSMTGYAARTFDLACGVLSIELKSVNSRYLDFQFRIGEELRATEPVLRELFNTRLSRGKIECRLNFTAASARTQAHYPDGYRLVVLMGECEVPPPEVVERNRRQAEQDHAR